MLAEILEIFMVVCFGISWPTSIIKSYTSRTAKGKSVFFLIMILCGYACGVATKFAGDKINYVVFFYILNFCMVFVDLCLYFRNKKLDAKTESKKNVENKKTANT